MEYNFRRYSYPSGDRVSVYKKTITRQEKNKENTNNQQNKQNRKNENFTKAHHNENRTKEAEEHCKTVSRTATKNKIYNIARSNTWDWFITLTFDREKVNSTNYDEVTRRITQFMNNIRKKKCPDMVYLIVPELHKDGKHYHFHGLLTNVDGLHFTESGKTDKSGHTIYNIREWNYGFTTATRVQDAERVSSYITKYLTKDCDMELKNKKHYLCSHNVNRTKAEYGVVDEEGLLQAYGENITYAKNVKIPAARQSINYYEFKKGSLWESPNSP